MRDVTNRSDLYKPAGYEVVLFLVSIAEADLFLARNIHNC